MNLNDELVSNGEKGVMKVKNHNGSRINLIKIPTVSSYYRFQRNFKEADVMKTIFKEINSEKSYEQGVQCMLKCM